MRYILIYFIAIIVAVALACGSNNKINPIEPEIDLSPYAIQNPTFNCERLKEQIGDKTFSIAFLWGSFGDNNQCLKDIFTNNQMGLFEIHSLNAWCLRDGVCHKDTEVYKGTPERFAQLVTNREGWLMQDIVERLEDIKRFLNTNPTDARCYISTGLETMLSPEANNVIVRLVKNTLPNCSVVYNPIKPTTERGEADYLEIHGNTVAMTAPCIANLDGVDARDINVDNFKEMYKDCDMQFIWTTEDNCIDPNRFIAPHLRVCN